MHLMVTVIDSVDTVNIQLIYMRASFKHHMTGFQSGHTHTHTAAVVKGDSCLPPDFTE